MESHQIDIKINKNEKELIDKLFDTSKQVFKEFLKSDNNPSDLITYEELVKYLNKNEFNYEFISYNHSLLFINDLLVSILEECLKNEDIVIKKQEKEIESVYLKAMDASQSLNKELQNQLQSSIGTGLRTPKKTRDTSDIIDDLETMTLDYSTFNAKYININNDSNVKAKWLNSNKSKNETVEYSIAKGDLSFNKNQLNFEETKIYSNKTKFKNIDKRFIDFENQIENIICEFKPNSNNNNYASSKDFQLSIIKLFKESVIDSLMMPTNQSKVEASQRNDKDKIVEEIKELDKIEKELDEEIRELKAKSQNKNNTLSLFTFKSTATLFNLALALCIFLIIIFYN